MKYTYLKCLYIILSFFILTGNAPAQERLALVIGNGDYYSVPSLANPVNDAKYMAIVLENLGFKVILKLNASKKAMKKAVREFGRGLHRDDVALFYYAGYSLQFKNQNYLVPVNANIKAYNNIKFEGGQHGSKLKSRFRGRFGDRCSWNCDSGHSLPCCG